MNRTIIAIDPGKEGGFAVAVEGAALEDAHKMWETEGDIVEGLRTLKQSCTHQPIAYIEQVGGYRPGRPQPGSAMFNFGRGFGFILGVLQTLGFRIELVPPQRWQKTLALHRNGETDTAWKNKLKARAQQLFPHLKVTLNTADALLLLEYGRRRHP